MDPKLLMKILQVTFTGGPVETEKRSFLCLDLHFCQCLESELKINSGTSGT